MMKFHLAICVLLTFSFQAIAADLFENNDVLEVEIRGPLDTVFHNKEDELKYPFVLRSRNEELQIMLRARGNSRKEQCGFPPLRLDFDADLPPGSLFFGQDKLKLVTHCNKSDNAQASALKEYAAYRFFALLSDAAFRVRLLHITYNDTDGKRDTSRYGFLIEPTGALAKRIGGQAASLPAVSLQSLNDEQEALVYVFQYLIGNTDWSLVQSDNDDDCCHNGKLIEKDRQLLYVPYDFDLSGLVNASYAYPDRSLHITRVTQRRYRGFCMDGEVLKTAIQNIRSHQGDFMTIIDNLPALLPAEKDSINRFVVKFFDETDDEQKILALFRKRCLN